MPFRPVFDHWFALWSAIAVGVFVLVTGVLVVALVRNRAGRRRTLPLGGATQNNVVEGSIVALLAGAAGFLVWGSLTANAAVDDGVGLAAEAAGPPPVTISVDAYRWCWDFTYRQAPIRVSGECTTGDFPTVVVPAGQPVEFDLTSRDVVHAFWLPDFAAKRDVYPDHENTLRMAFPREGTFRGRCSEFCGTHHVTMDFFVRVVSPEQYQQFLASGGAAA